MAVGIFMLSMRSKELCCSYSKVQEPHINIASDKHRNRDTANSDDILRHTVIYRTDRNAIPDIIHYIDLYALQSKQYRGTLAYIQPCLIRHTHRRNTYSYPLAPREMQLSGCDRPIVPHPGRFHSSATKESRVSSGGIPRQERGLYEQLLDRCCLSGDGACAVCSIGQQCLRHRRLHIQGTGISAKSGVTR